MENCSPVFVRIFDWAVNGLFKTSYNFVLASRVVLARGLSVFKRLEKEEK